MIKATFIGSLKQARELGYQYHYTGDPCAHGHKASRYVNGAGCTECANLRAKKRYWANPEAKKEMERERRAAYRVSMNAEKRADRATNPERYRELDRKRYRRDKEKRQELANRWQDQNYEKVLEIKRQWNKRNPGAKNFWTACRRAQLYNATPPWLTDEHWSEIQSYYELAAKLTREAGVSYEVDHIFPLQGEDSCGLHVPWNLQVLTAAQNRSKGNRMPAEMIEKAA